MGTLKKPAKIDENAAAANEMMAAMAAVKAGKVPPKQPEHMVTLKRAIELASGEAQPTNCGEAALALALHRRITAFELGAIVTLKSGGHLMTICDDDCAEDPRTPICVLFSVGGKLVEESLPRGCLRLATEEEMEIARVSVDYDMPF